MISQWFKKQFLINQFITKVDWTSPKPFRAGTTRTVTLNGIKVDEVFVVWDHGNSGQPQKE